VLFRSGYIGDYVHKKLAPAKHFYVLNNYKFIADSVLNMIPAWSSQQGSANPNACDSQYFAGLAPWR
jgi:hypothetical protein